MHFYNLDQNTDGSASFYGVREGMDTFSFDLKISFYGQTKYGFYIFYQRVCFVVCAETRLAFFLFLMRQCASFSFCCLKIGQGFLTLWLQNGSVSFHGFVSRLIRKRVYFALWCKAGHAFCTIFITKWPRFVLWSEEAYSCSVSEEAYRFLQLYGVNQDVHVLQF